MVAISQQNRAALTELCQRYRVERLYLFGSALADRFDVQRSDLDFLDSFLNREPTGDYADRYLGFADDLERLFGRQTWSQSSPSATRAFDARSKPPGSLSMTNRTRALPFDILESGRSISDWGIAHPHLAHLLTEVETLRRDPPAEEQS